MFGLTIRVEDTATGRVTSAAFTQSPVNVGRSALNQLRLEEGFVSQWHGCFRFDEQSVSYVDMGSTNGTDVDGKRLQKGLPVVLQQGTELRIGPLRLQAALSEVEAPTAVPSPQTVFALRSQLLSSSAEPAHGAGGAVPAATPAEAPRSPRAMGSGPSPAAAANKAHEPVKLAMEEYVTWRKAYLRVHDAVAAHLDATPAKERAAEVNRIVARLPALAQEKMFRELIESSGLPLPEVAKTPAPIRSSAGFPAAEAPAASGGPAAHSAVGAPGQADGPVLALLNEFVRSYLPAEARLRGMEDVEAFLERLAEVLEAFGRSFVELHRGQDQFGEELSIRTVTSQTPLATARGPKDVLTYLLDWRADGGARIAELTHGFAELMIHQLALLNGMRAGARALLQHLHPQRIDADEGPPLRVGFLPLPGRSWPFRSLARWRKYAAQHQVLEEEEMALTRIVFGREFARAYATIAGGSGGTAPPGDPEESR